MGKVISLVDRLREKNNQVEYAQGRYPLFEGKVIAVSARYAGFKYIVPL